jgi:hypothetical protein
MCRIGRRQLPLEFAPDRPCRLRRPHDQQLRRRGYGSELRPTLPGRERSHLLGKPSQQLLEPPKVGLDFGRDDRGGSWVVEHSIHPASRGLPHRDLWVGAPAKVQLSEESFEDSGLMPVADRWPCVRVQPSMQIEAKRGGQPGVRVDRGSHGVVLDPLEVGMVHACRARNLPAGQARILAEATDVLSEAPMDPGSCAACFGELLGTGHDAAEQRRLTSRPPRQAAHGDTESPARGHLVPSGDSRSTHRPFWPSRWRQGGRVGDCGSPNHDARRAGGDWQSPRGRRGWNQAPFWAPSGRRGGSGILGRGWRERSHEPPRSPSCTVTLARR